MLAKRFLVLMLFLLSNPVSPVFAQGNCECPQQRDASGKMCGDRSAASRSGDEVELVLCQMKFGGDGQSLPPPRRTPELNMSYPETPLVNMGPSEVRQFHAMEDVSGLYSTGSLEVQDRGQAYDFPKVQAIMGQACRLGVRLRKDDGKTMEDLVAAASVGRFWEPLLGMVGAKPYTAGGKDVVIVTFDQYLAGYKDGMVGRLQDDLLGDSGNAYRSGFTTIGFYWMTPRTEALMACIARTEEIGMSIMSWSELLLQIEID